MLGDIFGELSIEEFFMGKKISMNGAQDFLALFKKNNEKINMKKVFQLKALKLKTNRNYYAYEVLTSS